MNMLTFVDLMMEGKNNLEIPERGIDRNLQLFHQQVKLLEVIF